MASGAREGGVRAGGALAAHSSIHRFSQSPKRWSQSPSSVFLRSFAISSQPGLASHSSRVIAPPTSAGGKSLTPSIWWNAGKCDASISSRRYTSPVQRNASLPSRSSCDWCADVCVRSSTSVDAETSRPPGRET